MVALNSVCIAPGDCHLLYLERRSDPRAWKQRRLPGESTEEEPSTGTQVTLKLQTALSPAASLIKRDNSAVKSNSWDGYDG